MKLTTKGRYAVTALLDIVMFGQGEPINVSDIAVRQGISQAYLEQLMVMLRVKGLLMSTKGPGGGYQLAKLPQEITLANVVLAVNENLDATRCQGEANCDQGDPCLTHQIWEELSAELLKYLESITLDVLAKRPQILSVAKRQRAKFFQRLHQSIEVTYG